MLCGWLGSKHQLTKFSDTVNPWSVGRSFGSSESEVFCLFATPHPPFPGSTGLHHHHLSLNHEGCWGTTNNFTTSFLHFPLFSTALWGPAILQACPFPDAVFSPLPLSALSSSPFHCALQGGFGQTWWTGDMTIPLQFASLYDRQEVFVWSNCWLDLGTDFLVGNMVFYEMCSILR